MNKSLFEEMYNLAAKVAVDNKDLIEKTGYSSVGCVIVGESGKFYTGLCVGWFHSFCAEVSALSNALQGGERSIKYVTAAKYNKRNGKVHSLTPCGICREMFNQIFPEVKVVYIENEEYVVKTISEMLPDIQSN